MQDSIGVRGLRIIATKEQGDEGLYLTSGLQSFRSIYFVCSTTLRKWSCGLRFYDYLEGIIMAAGALSEEW